MSPWPPAIVIPWRSRSASRSATASIPGGRQDACQHGGAVVVGRVELEAHRLRARRGRRARARRDARRPVRGPRRGSAPSAAFSATTVDVAGVNGVLPFSCAAAQPCPVPVEARQRRRRPPSPTRARRSTRRRGPGGVISAFCEPVTTTSMPHASVSSGTAPRLEIASTTEIAPASLQAATSGWMSETTPVEVSEWTMNATSAPLSASARETSSARGVCAPLVRQRHDVARRTRPPASASACRTRRARRRAPSHPGERRLANADSNAPVPDAVKTSTSFFVRKTSCSRASRLEEDRLEVGRAVVDDRLGERRQHLGRHGRRAGREEIALLRHRRRA